MRKWMAPVGLLLVLVLATCAWALTAKHTTAQSSATKAPAAIPVAVAQVEQSPISKQAQALGTLAAIQSAVISSQVDGRIDKIFFKNGQKVGKGMPIIQLDNAMAKADYQSAVAALNLSRSKYRRAKLVVAQGAISQQQLDQLKADVESKEAAVKSSLAALNQKELVAPFTGVLGAFNVKMGDFISQGDPIVTLVNKQQLRVKYALPERLMPELKTGQVVFITANAYPKKVFDGTVTFISPTVDKTSRSVAVEAVVPNPKDLLSPGMFVQVTQQLAVDETALVVPDQAVTASVQGYTVYKVVDNRAILTNVKVGVRLGGEAQILSGLKKGDAVVIAGQQKLQDGSLVKVLNNPDEGSNR